MEVTAIGPTADMETFNRVAAKRPMQPVPCASSTRARESCWSTAPSSAGAWNETIHTCHSPWLPHGTTRVASALVPWLRARV